MPHKSDSIETSPLRDVLLQAQNSTDENELLQLAMHPNNGVARLVASNLNTPLVTLTWLLNHTNASVREAVCKNHAMPRHYLDIALNDPMPKVRKAARARWGRWCAHEPE